MILNLESEILLNLHERKDLKKPSANHSQIQGALHYDHFCERAYFINSLD